ncbi:hypothetical protein NL676_030090 [Syzygium grande]|nr:hypothetical protein NL676_030090 [Syzygium grande]
MLRNIRLNIGFSPKETVGMKEGTSSTGCGCPRQELARLVVSGGDTAVVMDSAGGGADLGLLRGILESGRCISE